MTRPAWLRALLALLLLALLIPLSAGAQTGPWPGGMSLPTVAGGTCPITRCWAGTGPPPEEPAITLNEARAICERHTHFSQYGGGGDIPGFVVDKDEQQLCERVARAQNKADLAALKAFVDGMKP